MSKYKSLAFTAKYFGVSSRMFAQDVVDKRIPFIVIGKRKKFDIVAVEAHLATLELQRDNIVQFVRPVRSRPQKKTKFAEALGI